MERMEERVKVAVEKVEREMEGGGKRKRGWWDKGCKEVKREVKKLAEELEERR